MAQKFSNEFFLSWLSHPVTQTVFQALIERQHQENLSFITNNSLNSEQYMIERNLYRLMGKNEIIKKLTDRNLLKTTLLKEYVIWSDEKTL